MKQAKTITDLDSKYIQEIDKLIDEARRFNITAGTFLSLVKSIQREYLKERDRINGKEI